MCDPAIGSRCRCTTAWANAGLQILLLVTQLVDGARHQVVEQVHCGSSLLSIATSKQSTSTETFAAPLLCARAAKRGPCVSGCRYTSASTDTFCCMQICRSIVDLISIAQLQRLACEEPVISVVELLGGCVTGAKRCLVPDLVRSRRVVLGRYEYVDLGHPVGSGTSTTPTPTRSTFYRQVLGSMYSMYTQCKTGRCRWSKFGGITMWERSDSRRVGKSDR